MGRNDTLCGRHELESGERKRTLSVREWIMDEIVVGMVNGEESVRWIWPEAESFVRRALDHSRGEIGVDDVKERLLDGRMLLWGVWHQERKQFLGLLVTEVIEYPRVKLLRVVTVAGVRLDEWGGLVLETFEKFCRKYDLDGVEAVGRKGLARVLKKLGFEERYTVVYKEVT